MPRYRTQIPHDLGRDEALARLQAFSRKAGDFSNVEGTWEGARYSFAASIQGIRVRGTLAVEADHLDLDARLPLVAMPFAGWFPRFVKTALAAPAPEGAGAGGGPGGAAAEPDASAADGALSDPVVLFLHVPKAGGTTLSEYIYGQVRGPADPAEADGGLWSRGVLFLSHGFFREPETPGYLRPLLARPDLRAVLGHLSFGLHAHLERPSTYVTLLRDPVERVVSMYHYLQMEGRMTLEAFAERPPFKEVDNDQTRRIAGVDPPVGACTAAHLEAAKDNLREHFAVVGTTERFAETVVALTRAFGWRHEPATYPRNVNAGRPATESVPARAVEAVRARNRLDAELHAFAGGLLDQAARGPGFADDLAAFRATEVDVSAVSGRAPA